MSRHFESTIAIKRIPLFFFVLLLRSRDYQQKGFSLFSFFFLYFLSPTHLFQRLHVSTFNGVPSEAQKKKGERKKKRVRKFSQRKESISLTANFTESPFNPSQGSNKTTKLYIQVKSSVALSGWHCVQL